jgi:hypothetical protein
MTAVEWLAEQLLTKYRLKIDNYQEFKQAKEKENQKLIEMHDKGFDSVKQLNDDYAISFAEWIEELSGSHIDSLDYHLYLDNDVKELLEIFKKEKGL